MSWFNSYPVFDVSDTYLVFDDEVTISHIASRYAKAFPNDGYDEDEGLMALMDNPDVVYDSYNGSANSICVSYKYGEKARKRPPIEQDFVVTEILPQNDIWEHPKAVLAVPIKIVDDTWCEVLFGTKNPYWVDIIGHIGSFKFTRVDWT